MSGATHKVGTRLDAQYDGKEAQIAPRRGWPRSGEA